MIPPGPRHLLPLNLLHKVFDRYLLAKLEFMVPPPRDAPRCRAQSLLYVCQMSLHSGNLVLNRLLKCVK